MGPDSQNYHQKDFHFLFDYKFPKYTRVVECLLFLEGLEKEFGGQWWPKGKKKKKKKNEKKCLKEKKRKKEPEFVFEEENLSLLR